MCGASGLIRAGCGTIIVIRPVSLVGVSLLHLATSGVLYTPVSAWTR